jgi:hypothetical protein
MLTEGIIVRNGCEVMSLDKTGNKILGYSTRSLFGIFPNGGAGALWYQIKPWMLSNNSAIYGGAARHICNAWL